MEDMEAMTRVAASMVVVRKIVQQMRKAGDVILVERGEAYDLADGIGQAVGEVEGVDVELSGVLEVERKAAEDDAEQEEDKRPKKYRHAEYGFPERPAHGDAGEEDGHHGAVGEEPCSVKYGPFGGGTRWR